MKKYLTPYWISTVLLGGFFLLNGFQQLTLNAHLVEEYAPAQLPLYLLQFMGLGKFLAAIAILVPLQKHLSWVKEWAYAGLVFILVGAAYSHMLLQYEMGHVIQVAVLLVLVTISAKEFRKR